MMNSALFHVWFRKSIGGTFVPTVIPELVGSSVSVYGGGFNLRFAIVDGCWQANTGNWIVRNQVKVLLAPRYADLLGESWVDSIEITKNVYRLEHQGPFACVCAHLRGQPLYVVVGVYPDIETASADALMVVEGFVSDGYR